MPRAEELRRAIHSYNPTRRVTPEGRDEWGVDPYEGVLVALTVAYTEGQIGPARVYLPIGRLSDGTARAVEAIPGRANPYARIIGRGGPGRSATWPRRR